MKKHLPTLALLITLALIGVSSLLPIRAMWGLNHLQYLPSAYSILLVLAISAIAVLWLGWPLFSNAEGWAGAIDRFLFRGGWWPKILATVLSCVFFYALRLDTFLLGDGYLLLSAFAQDKTQIHKWSEQGSIWLVRAVQDGIGAYSRDTALLAFQILSCASGAVAVYSFVGIARQLSDDARTRLLAFVTLIGSGGMLLFLGYVEHYPVVWAVITVFFYLALRFCQTGKGLWAVLLSFGLAVALHLQALMFAPATVYLVIHRLGMEKILFARRMYPRVPVIVAYVAVVVGVLWLSRLRMDYEVIFLPLLAGRPASPGYAMFSLKHLLDILNLIFLVLPGWLALAAAGGGKADAYSVTARFLLLAVAGSLTFLVIIDPALGMARDWDLMSLSCLPTALWLLLRVKTANKCISGRFLAGYSITVFLATALFVIAAEHRTAAENRAIDLLRLYGSKNNSGWVVLADYHRDRGDGARASAVVKEMKVVFADDTLLVQGRDLLERQRYSAAFAAAERLVKRDPYRPEYLQLMANSCGKLGRIDLATAYYIKAILLRPYDPRLRNEYGQMLLKAGRNEEALEVLSSAYELDQSLTFVLEGMGLAHINLGFLDSASQTADKLFASDSHQPGGHLIMMVLALRQSDTESGRRHFEQYLKYGQDRSDYERIRDYYGYLIPR